MSLLYAYLVIGSLLVFVFLFSFSFFFCSFVFVCWVGNGITFVHNKIGLNVHIIDHTLHK